MAAEASRAGGAPVAARARGLNWATCTCPPPANSRSEDLAPHPAVDPRPADLRRARCCAGRGPAGAGLLVAGPDAAQAGDAGHRPGAKRLRRVRQALPEGPGRPMASRWCWCPARARRPTCAAARGKADLGFVQGGAGDAHANEEAASLLRWAACSSSRCGCSTARTRRSAAGAARLYLAQLPGRR